MSNLPTRISRLVAFDEKRTHKMWTAATGETVYRLNSTSLCKDYLAGAHDEMIRLLPLLQQLPKLAEALSNTEDILRIIYLTSEGSNKVRAHAGSVKLTAALTALEAVVLKMEGE